MISDIKPTTLLALARAATPGPWRQIDRCVSASTDEACGVTSDHLDMRGHLRGVFRSDAYDECSHPVSAADAAYIAAASPDVIVSLCERVEALEKALAAMTAERGCYKAALLEACDIADGVPTHLPRSSITALRALAESKP